MRVLIVHRKGVFATEGGEQDQTRNTRAALDKLGVETELVDTLPANLGGYDLAHFFGLDYGHIEEIRRAKGLPIALTPVFWDKAEGYPLDVEYEEWPRNASDKLKYWLWRVTGLRDRRVGNIARIQFHANLQRFAAFQDVIDDIGIFLPNSEAEWTSLSSFYVIEKGTEPFFRHRVVPNAVDMTYVDNPSDYAQRNLPIDGPMVCCCGGIDRRKNQYFLVKALMDVDVPLVIAGGTRDARYAEMVKRLASRRKGIYFTGHLNQADLHSVYRAATVHALPSIYDTPGITSLEAVAHECVNVSTQVGGLREYLGDHSLYCNSFSVSHIRKQVLKALEMPPNVEGAKLVRSKFTYDNVARATLDAYNDLLSA